MTTHNYRTASRGALGATLMSASAVTFACFLVGCPGAVLGTGGLGGLSSSCTSLLQESSELGQSLSANPTDVSVQCQVFANQIAIVDAGCFAGLPSIGGPSADDLRAAAESAQQQLGCN